MNPSSSICRRRKVTKENRIQSGIVRFLRKQKDCWVYPTCDRFTVGVPDILGCFKGRFFALEVKKPTGRLSKIQAYQLDKVRNAGGIAARVDSLEDAKEALDI